MKYDTVPNLLNPSVNSLLECLEHILFLYSHSNAQSLIYEEPKTKGLMNIDPGIIQFTHCNASIFCRKLPETCAVCQREIEESILPVRVPFPFVKAKQYPCSIFIKPSTGDFLNCYSLQDPDLHIGITSSKGIVVEYDVSGITKSNTEIWDECILIYKLENSSWFSRWDSVLMSTADKYLSLEYNAYESNCYSFVLEFMQKLQFAELELFAESKEVFCEKIVIPKLKDSYKYILLFRQTENNKVFIQS